MIPVIDLVIYEHRRAVRMARPIIQISAVLKPRVGALYVLLRFGFGFRFAVGIFSPGNSATYAHFPIRYLINRLGLHWGCPV